MEFVNLFADVFVTVLTYIIAKSTFVKAETPKDCWPNDTQGCSCNFTDGSGVMDLRSFGTTDNEPWLKDIQGQDGNLYSFSACNGFTEGSCMDAVMCVTQEGNQTKIGGPGITIFQYSEDTQTVTAVYTVKGSFLTLSMVEYICDPNACQPEFIPLGNTTVGLYKFKLTHVCACPGLCNENGAINCLQNKAGYNTFGPGTIATVIFFGILIVYLVGGVLYLKVKRKASGTDLIPNKDVWNNLKNLVTAGIMFTFGKCLPKKFQYDSKH